MPLLKTFQVALVQLMPLESGGNDLEGVDGGAIGIKNHQPILTEHANSRSDFLRPAPEVLEKILDLVRILIQKSIKNTAPKNLTMNTQINPPSATLYIATGCTHCPAVLHSLSDLLKQGVIGRLEVINIAAQPEIARKHGVRSVPWARIGPFTLHGKHTTTDLRRWAERAGTTEGMQDYLAELLENQRLGEALELALEDADWIRIGISMLSDLETPMGVRIGIGALLEDLAGQDRLAAAEPGLRKLLGAPESQVRADAAYYLGLSSNPEVRDWITPLLQDEDPEVREIVREALEPE